MQPQIVLVPMGLEQALRLGVDVLEHVERRREGPRLREHHVRASGVHQLHDRPENVAPDLGFQRRLMDLKPYPVQLAGNVRQCSGHMALAFDRGDRADAVPKKSAPEPPYVPFGTCQTKRETASMALQSGETSVMLSCPQCKSIRQKGALEMQPRLALVCSAVIVALIAAAPAYGDTLKSAVAFNNGIGQETASQPADGVEVAYQITLKGGELDGCTVDIVE
jgi:hypothetical protein